MEAFAKELWREFSIRIREENVPLETITQFGVFITLKASQKIGKSHLPIEMDIEE